MASNRRDRPSQSPPPAAEHGDGVASVVVRIFLPLIVLAGGVIGFVFLAKEPPPPTPPAPESKPVEARVRELRRENYQITVRAQGSIRAHSQVGLTAQVSGRVKTIHPCFEDGAFFKKDEILLELDPVDFEVAVVAAAAQLAQAELTLQQETLRSEQAALDWKDLGYDEEPNELVLRKPQMRLAARQVELAEAQQLSAQRNLARSKVRAPFDGRVLNRSVGVGQTIGGSLTLGTIFATDYSEVRLPVATRFLPDLSLPEDSSDPPVPVLLDDGLARDSVIRWDASILRTEGALDARTLELFAIARIDDPFGLASAKVPLRIGQPVKADIPGRILEDVFVIPREAVTGLTRIRLVDPAELTLQSATITPIWEDEDRLVFRDESIDDGMLLVMTRLMYAPDGGKIVIMEDEIPVDPSTAAAGPEALKELEGAGKE
jgi:RND family efflux transporter MFP subunit